MSSNEELSHMQEITNTVLSAQQLQFKSHSQYRPRPFLKRSAKPSKAAAHQNHKHRHFQTGGFGTKHTEGYFKTFFILIPPLLSHTEAEHADVLGIVVFFGRSRCRVGGVGELCLLLRLKRYKAPTDLSKHRFTVIDVL